MLCPTALLKVNPQWTGIWPRGKIEFLAHHFERITKISVKRPQFSELLCTTLWSNHLNSNGIGERIYSPLQRYKFYTLKLHKKFVALPISCCIFRTSIFVHISKALVFQGMGFCKDVCWTFFQVSGTFTKLEKPAVLSYERFSALTDTQNNRIWRIIT